jgi:hypothetical protein
MDALALDLMPNQHPKNHEQPNKHSREQCTSNYRFRRGVNRCLHRWLADLALVTVKGKDTNTAAELIHKHAKPNKENFEVFSVKT